MNIAVTGNVGSGKSAVSAILAGLLRVEHVDADSLCRELLMAGREGWLELRKKWPKEFFNKEGELDRRRLRDAVFTSSDVRIELEHILHPLVQARLERIMQSGDQDKQHLLAEIPLLYEVGWEGHFDYVVAVYAPSHTCVERTAERDGVSRRQVDSILALQLSPEVKAERADFVIDNSESWTQTAVQTAVVSRELQRLGAV